MGAPKINPVHMNSMDFNDFGRKIVSQASVEHLGDQLRTLGEAFCNQMSAGADILFTPWQESKKQNYVELLRNHWELAFNIPRNIGSYLERVSDISFEYRKFLFNFGGHEEIGHEKMIERDLQNLGVPVQPPKGWVPHYALTALLAHPQFSARHGNPCSYLGHVFCLETLGAYLKTRKAKGEVFGYPKETKLWLDSHADLNDEHADVAMKLAVKICKTEEDARSVLQASYNTANLYLHFFKDIFGTK